jgi:hypothetical protein
MAACHGTAAAGHTFTPGAVTHAPLPRQAPYRELTWRAVRALDPDVGFQPCRFHEPQHAIDRDLL